MSVVNTGDSLPFPLGIPFPLDIPGASRSLGDLPAVLQILGMVSISGFITRVPLRDVRSGIVIAFTDGPFTTQVAPNSFRRFFSYKWQQNR